MPIAARATHFSSRLFLFALSLSLSLFLFFFLFFFLISHSFFFRVSVNSSKSGGPPATWRLLSALQIAADKGALAWYKGST